MPFKVLSSASSRNVIQTAAVILLSQFCILRCRTPAPTIIKLGMISTNINIPAQVVHGEWKMECTAESRENRGIVKRHYGEWGPVIFHMPRGDLTYTCTTDGGYSAVRLGALAKTECVFVNDGTGCGWILLASHRREAVRSRLRISSASVL